MRMTQDTIDYHCKQIREALSKGDTTLLACLNYLKNTASDPNTRRDWSFVGACLVMHGHLTVNDKNDFERKLIGM